MADFPVDALVEEVLTHAADHTADSLREEAVNLAFDMKLPADDLTALLAALEARTGARLERRAARRPAFAAARGAPPR